MGAYHPDSPALGALPMPMDMAMGIGGGKTASTQPPFTAHSRSGGSSRSLAQPPRTVTLIAPQAGWCPAPGGRLRGDEYRR